jgi:peptidoglycan hydrolase-like protein with peptidoglycan-binding domain
MRWRPGYRNDPGYWQRSLQSPFAPGQGTRDEQIRWVQYSLNRILNQNLPIDGVMSPATRTAVRNFQQRSGLPVTGYVGPDTQQALLTATSSTDSMPSDSGGDMTGAAAGNAGADIASGALAGASTQTPPGPNADARELLEEYGLPSGEFEFPSEFENWESELQPGYSPFPASREADFEMETAAASQQRSNFALVRAIPDDPDYRKYIPIDYRLNAKTIIGEVAQDIKSNGQSAHFYTELVHSGLVAAEIFADVSAIVGSIATFGLIAGPFLGVVLVGLGLGAPYAEAAQEIAEKSAASGFSRGVVMGADKRQGGLVREYFGNDYFPPNPFLPNGRAIAVANYRMGLLVGFFQGRRLSENQRAIFWHDLGQRMGYQSYRGPSKQWSQREWRDWYITVAAIFRRDHLDK